MVRRRGTGMENAGRALPATQAADGDQQVTTLDDGWRLTVTLHKGAVCGATAELRNDTQHFAITRQSTTLFDLAAEGFEPSLSIDSSGNPAVVWRRDDASPFVWFCGIDVADWSHPL